MIAIIDYDAGNLKSVEKALQFVVNCSAVERINMIVGGPVALGVTRLAEHGVPLTEAFYPLTGKETYIRAECIDEHGHTAWTNPIWLSEFAKRRK